MPGEPVDAAAALLEAARQGAGRFAPRGLEYLCQVVSMGARRDGHAPHGPWRHLGPDEICRAFAARAARDFGPMASHVLGRWGLRDGAALGEAVFLLAEKRCLALGPDDKLEDYAAAGEFRFP